MTTPTPPPPPPEEAPYRVPEHLAFHFDPVARILRIAFRGRFELREQLLDVPVPFIKQVAGGIAQFEARAELAAPSN